MLKPAHIFVIGFSILAATQAHAISRYNSLSMTCAEANELAQQEGAVILRYPSRRVPGMTLYERAVRNSNQCNNHERAETRFVATSDAPRCAIRACVVMSADEWWPQH